MVQIVLNDEQIEILTRASGPVRFVDRSGRDFGKLVPPPADALEPASALDPDVALALERMQAAKRGEGKFYSSKEVLDHLLSLERS